MIFKLFFLILFINSFCSFSQQRNTLLKFKPYKLGIFYGYGNEENFLFNDKDYAYKTEVIKVTIHYPISEGFFQFELNLQPQVHFIEHQLLNEYFVLTTDENYEENRVLFTKKKSMQLYAIQFELLVKRKISRKLEGYAFMGIGPAVIDTETERVAKGFTIIENLGIGISYEISNNLLFDIKPNFNHVSNAQIKLPNSGYNTFGIEIGLSIKL